MIDESCPKGNWLLLRVLFEKSEVFKRLSYQQQNIGKIKNGVNWKTKSKKLIIQKLNEKYGISVELYQIKEIPLKEFQCDLHLNHDDDETVTKGSTKVSLTRYPLRVDFQANEKEMGFLEKMLLSDHHNELELECAYKSNIGLEETVIIKFENQESVIEF